MPEPKEVFEMVTQKSRPDKGALERQHSAQVGRRRRNQRIGAVALAAAVIVALAVLFYANPTAGSDSRPAGEGTVRVSPVEPVAAATEPAFVGLDGDIVSRVQLPADAWEPALSADGQWVAYVTRATDVGFCGACTAGPRIAAVRVDGTGSHFVTFHRGAGTGTVGQPAWSPDGSRIAFVGPTEGHGLGNIFVVDADGTHLRRLTSGRTQKGWPSWSPDGTHIIYNDAGGIPLDSDGYSNTQEIYSVAADGSTAPVRVTTNHFNDSEAVYSPDGSRIALFQGGLWSSWMPTARTPGGSPTRGSRPAGLPTGRRSRSSFTTPSSGTHSSIHAREASGDFPRLDVKVLTVATGEVSDLGMSVATDLNAVSWTPDSQSLFVNRASNPA